MPVLIVSVVIALIGIGLLIVSNVMYAQRTHDNLWRRFWLGRDLLTKNEYLLNRTGFWLSLAGIVLMFLVRLTPR